MLLILLFRHESEVDRLKSVCVQAPIGLHVSLGPPAAADVGEVQWQFSTADRFYVGAGTRASSNCSLYTTNGNVADRSQTGRHESVCVQGGCNTSAILRQTSSI
ncbi:hypothetical protein AVEN_246712-1 [Araneus ventricosus]|uniref:Uncharacterized protein n=1 Tax=Araneus ventricosus TaxID=182803 RepID=A0A4Y2JTM3_ARAVE|nr:hypothetical protein AVEN_246712-1 [Araneus ventricosus]